MIRYSTILAIVISAFALLYARRLNHQMDDSKQDDSSHSTSSFVETDATEAPTGSLQALVKQSNLDAVRLLLEGRVESKAEDTGDTSTLWVAIEYGREPMVRLLLEHGVILGTPPNLDGTWLSRGEDDPALLSLLIEYGLTIEGELAANLLYEAASAGHDQIIEFLLFQKDVDINSQSLRHSKSPLHVAAFEEATGTVSLLLKHGADPNARDSTGRTPLHYVAAPNQPWDSARNGEEITRDLLQRGALPDARDEKGATPMQVALRSGQQGVANALIEGGVNIHAALADDRGSNTTALHLALRTGQSQITEVIPRLLIARGASVNARDATSGETAFHIALDRVSSDPRLASELIESGQADVSILGVDGLTSPLHLVAGSHSISPAAYTWLGPGPQLSFEAKHEQVGRVVALLIEHGADVEARGAGGRTPLMEAVRADNLYMVWLLLQRYNASVHARDDLGRTPLLALPHTLDDIPRLLLARGADAKARDENGLTSREVILSHHASENEKVIVCLRAFEDDAERAKIDFKPPECSFDELRSRPQRKLNAWMPRLRKSLEVSKDLAQ